MTKPMKPTKAWAIRDERGRLMDLGYAPSLFKTKADARTWSAVEAGESPLRVRIVEDAAVERAIAVLRKYYSPGWDDVGTAIRDLGGRP